MVHSIKIASTIQNINKIELFFNTIFKELKFSRKVYCKIYLSATEAVTNSIIHGNKKNPSSFVTLTFLEKDNQYIVTVEDEGSGFNYNILPDPLDKKNIMKESGRGIFIIKQYSDKVIFKNNGACVELIFNK